MRILVVALAFSCTKAEPPAVAAGPAPVGGATAAAPAPVAPELAPPKEVEPPPAPSVAPPPDGPAAQTSPAPAPEGTPPPSVPPTAPGATNPVTVGDTRSLPAVVVPPPPTPAELFAASVLLVAGVPPGGDVGPACAALRLAAPGVTAEEAQPHLERCSDLEAAKAPTCGALVGKAERCQPGGPDAPPREELVTACEAAVAATPGLLAAMGACLPLPCEPYGDCIHTAREASRRGERLAAIQSAGASGEFKKVSLLCSQLTGRSADADLIAACRTVAQQALDSWKPRLEAARVAGADKELLCFDAERWARVLGPEQQAATGDLCAEITLGRSVAEALAAAQRAKDAPPYECQATLDKLAKNESVWAATKRGDLARACYITLGARLLDRAGCPAGKRAVLEGLDHSGVDSSALGEAVARARAACAGGK